MDVKNGMVDERTCLLSIDSKAKLHLVKEKLDCNCNGACACPNLNPITFQPRLRKEIQNTFSTSTWNYALFDGVSYPEVYNVQPKRKLTIQNGKETLQKDMSSLNGKSNFSQQEAEFYLTDGCCPGLKVWETCVDNTDGCCGFLCSPCHNVSKDPESCLPWKRLYRRMTQDPNFLKKYTLYRKYQEDANPDIYTHIIFLRNVSTILYYIGLFSLFFGIIMLSYHYGVYVDSNGQPFTTYPDTEHAWKRHFYGKWLTVVGALLFGSGLALTAIGYMEYKRFYVKMERIYLLFIHLDNQRQIEHKLQMEGIVNEGYVSDSTDFSEDEDLTKKLSKTRVLRKPSLETSYESYPINVYRQPTSGSGSGSYRSGFDTFYPGYADTRCACGASKYGYRDASCACSPDTSDYCGSISATTTPTSGSYDTFNAVSLTQDTERATRTPETIIEIHKPSVKVNQTKINHGFYD